ncbi:hypothetical protein [Streptomyces sp. cmx-4-9]|uniref:hypothetical protein n=1 Tax=Streptomyces sp. cmx-4-9 TaxID=2790941 RepID=UPI003980D3AC
MYGNDSSSDGSRSRRRPGDRIRRALTALLVAGAAVACGPGATEGPAVSAPPAITSAAPTTAPPAPTPSPTPPPSPTPTAAPTKAPAPAPPAATTAPASGAGQKAPAAPTTRAAAKPAPQPTTKAPAPSAPPAAADCEIVSNAGNCYNAGQFCRKADIGRSTHAGNGRMIHCRQDGSQARWGY